MTPVGRAWARMTSRRPGRLLRLALTAATLALCGASAGLAAETLRFDGTQDTVEATSARRFAAGDLERLTLDVVVDRIDGPDSILFSLSGGATAFGAGFDPATRRVTLVSTERTEPRAIGPVLATGAGFTLELSRAAAGWGVSIDGGQPTLVGAKELDPAFAAHLDLGVGALGFVGAVRSLTVGLKGGETLVLGGDGVLQPARGGVAVTAGPRLGVYRRVDAAKEPGPTGESDLVYPSHRYFALVQRDGQLGLVFDWGGYLALAPDPATPRRFAPADPRFAWAGAITFDPSDNGYFTASDVSESYRPAEPLLTNGARYRHFVGSAERPYPKAAGGAVPLGSVFAQHAPSSFYFSIDGCYDLTRMDRTDLTRTGCSAPLFAMPPKSSAAYRPSGEGGQIIPFGWTYRIRSVSDGMEFTSLVEGASEVADAFSKMQGADWSGSFAGFKIESTQSASQSEQTRQLLENRSMGKVQHSISTSHAIVLEPDEVLLHHCFVKRVLRMAPGAKPPRYFKEDAEFDGSDTAAAVDRSAGRKDDCAEDLKQPLAVETFLDLYGTHYAHAITYGAWGRNVTTYSRRSIETVLAQSSEFKQALHIGFEKQGAKEDPLTGSGLRFGQTSSEATDGSARRQGGSEITTTGWRCVGGSSGSCEHGSDHGSLLVPVFLDLRLLDGLLAPPFFTDPAVIVDLRGRVQAAIAARLAAVTKVATVGPPALRAYRLDLEKVACRGDATACDSLMRVGALVVYGKAQHGGNVDLTPAQSVPLSTLAQPPAATKRGVGALPASPALPVLFVVDPGADDIDRIGISVAPSADPRISQPTEEGCCGTLAMSPTLCRVKTGERRDCVPVGYSVSCGDYMPFLEDMACPARPLSGADGESHLEWELVRPNLSRRATTAGAPIPESHVRWGVTQEIIAPFGGGSFAQRFVDEPLLKLKRPGNADVVLSLSGTLRTVDLAAHLGVPRGSAGVAVAFEAVSPGQRAVFGPGDPHMHMRCPGGSRHTAAGCHGIDPATPCQAPLVRYGGSCVRPDEDMQIGFLNDGAYVARAQLTYMLDGEPKTEAGRALLKGYSQTFDVPRRAKAVVMSATLEGVTRQEIFKQALSPEQGPRCFFVGGWWPKPTRDFKWNPCDDFARRTFHQFNGLPLEERHFQ